MDGFCCWLPRPAAWPQSPSPSRTTSVKLRAFAGVTEVVASTALLSLTAINCLGVRAGSDAQTVLMLLRGAAIAAMVVAGLIAGGGTG